MTPVELKGLIDSNRLALYGQPKWTFGQNTCNTYEVMVEKILQEDGTEIPAAGLLDEIEHDQELTCVFSEWFLRKSIQSALEITEKADANVTLSVNLLPGYANLPGFADKVRGIIEELGMNPRKLQFELSEAQRLSEEGTAALNALHDEDGIGLWIANFGTGFSNMDMLRHVHFDGLELDKSYAADVPDNEQTCRVVVAIQQMAQTLDLNICAKGIENMDQFDFYESLGFFKGQGYLIHEPIAIADMADYITMHGVHRRHNT